MIGLLKETNCAGKIHVSERGVAGIIVRIVAIIPLARNRISADGDFRPGNLVGQIQLPAQRTKLFRGVDYGVIPPADPGWRIIGDRKHIVHRSDNRLAVEQGHRVGSGVIDRQVEGAVA